jgi:hypothetical protein
MHLIDYGHRRQGVLYHGTLSDLDGEPKATWTYEKGGRKVTHDQPIDAATFRSLWNRIGNLDVFKRNRVRDANREVDPDGTHVISIIFGESENPQRIYFAVPTDETDPQFLNWVKSLNIPAGSSGPPPVPAKSKASKGPAAAREKVYAKFFGSKWTVDREDEPDGPPIDVYVFEPGEDGRGKERDFYTLVTSGMSDERMRVRKGVPFRRGELILYVADPTELHIGLLRFLARLPLVQETTWYGFGTTMTNGNPPRPIFDDSDLSCYLFLEPVVGRDNVVHEKLEVDGDPVAMLWVVPITEAECQYIIDRSPDEFLDLLDRKKHPFVLDEGRRSYVRAK